ncbi:hypothetical protein KP509_20G091500 [Ceratopteris richardii]|nr:hypothetical protein KP509_20G091500 [Ceratopteris richardii]
MAESLGLQPVGFDVKPTVGILNAQSCARNTRFNSLETENSIMNCSYEAPRDALAGIVDRRLQVGLKDSNMLESHDCAEDRFAERPIVAVGLTSRKNKSINSTLLKSLDPELVLGMVKVEKLKEDSHRYMPDTMPSKKLPQMTTVRIQTCNHSDIPIISDMKSFGEDNFMHLSALEGDLESGSSRNIPVQASALYEKEKRNLSRSIAGMNAILQFSEFGAIPNGGIAGQCKEKSADVLAVSAGNCQDKNVDVMDAAHALHIDQLMTKSQVRICVTHTSDGSVNNLDLHQLEADRKNPVLLSNQSCSLPIASSPQFMGDKKEFCNVSGTVQGSQICEDSALDYDSIQIAKDNPVQTLEIPCILEEDTFNVQEGRLNLVLKIEEERALTGKFETPQMRETSTIHTVPQVDDGLKECGECRTPEVDVTSNEAGIVNLAINELSTSEILKEAPSLEIFVQADSGIESPRSVDDTHHSVEIVLECEKECDMPRSTSEVDTSQAITDMETNIQSRRKGGKKKFASDGLYLEQGSLQNSITDDLAMKKITDNDTVSLINYMSRGRPRSLPSRFRDSVLEPLKKRKRSSRNQHDAKDSVLVDKHLSQDVPASCKTEHQE